MWQQGVLHRGTRQSDRALLLSLWQMVEMAQERRDTIFQSRCPGRLGQCKGQAAGHGQRSACLRSGLRLLCAVLQRNGVGGHTSIPPACYALARTAKAAKRVKKQDLDNADTKQRKETTWENIYLVFLTTNKNV